MHQVSWRRVIAAAVIAGVALVAPRAARAQTGKLSGVVTDAQTGQPIEGVQVRVLGTGFGALTQANGRYFIISVPSGTYTVEARRIGYQSRQTTGVSVRIDVTREVNFALNSAATTLVAVRTVAPPTPLVERGVTGAQQSISADVVTALPVTDVSGVLSLQQGFMSVPTQNTDIVSFTDSRRQVASPIRIRGGRGNETQTLIDGFPISNPVFGGPAFDVNTTAIQEINFQQGGFEPQYGNAQSGIINIGTREGGTNLAGSFEYQSSAPSGQLGSTHDKLLNFDLFRGFLSGPVPGTADKVRFMISGQQRQGRDQVLEFDQDVNNYSHPRTGANPPNQLDLFPGWRAFGYDAERDVVAKLTFLPTTTTRLNLLGIDYNRNRLPFDFDFDLVGFDPLSAPAIRTQADSILVNGLRYYQNNVQGSINVNRRFYGATLEQRFGRSNLKVRAGRLDQDRQTCNFFNGVCLGARFADENFDGQFVVPNRQNLQVPGTDTFYGGENVRTDMLRADIESQVTDHHNLQGGAFFARYNMDFSEVRNLGTNAELAVPQKYFAKPTEMALYLQDRIEYDFLTVKLGARYDYGVAKGSSYADPRDPTNGTTAREVCNGTAPSIGATTPYTYTDQDPESPTYGQTFTGLAACSQSSDLKKQATAAAQKDDFRKADPRSAFAPRIGVSFPLSESSSLFFNFGRYNQNPVYNNLYQNTGIGTVAGAAGGDVCPETHVKPGTKECYPIITADAYTPPYLGNANLKIEQTTSYEIGYASEFARNYAVNMTLYTKNQTGLSGIRRSKNIQDIGTTYGTSSPRYNVIVNQDYQTSRGFQLQFRRRVSNYWGYDINYTFSKTTTNAAPPDLQNDRVSQGDSITFREVPSEIDQPHVFNAQLLLRVDDHAPSIRWGGILRNTYLTLTEKAASGLPYTPSFSFTGFGDVNRGDENSGRGPSTFQTDLLAGKDIKVQNVRYGIFARVVNLFDQKNCVQVFATTGRCDSGTIDQDRARNGNSVGSDSPSTFFNRPGYYGERRSAYAGIRVQF